MSKQCGENGGRSLNGQPCKRTDLKDDGLCTKHTNGNGRFNEDEIAQIGKLSAVLTEMQLADFLGISHDTFGRRCKAQPEVMQQYKKGKAQMLANIATTGIKAALDGDRSWGMFILKTQGGWRETDRLEHTGADGGPIRHEHEEAEAIREQLYRRFKVIQGGRKTA